MILAGLPPTNEYGGTLLVTTLPAATIVPSPTVTPFKIIAFAPIHTLSSITTGSVCGLGFPLSS